MKRFLIIVTFLGTCLLTNAQDGSLDSTFGVNGKYTSLLPNNIQLGYSSAIHNDEIFSTCLIGSNNQRDFCVMKFMENGSIDSSFGTNGLAITNIGGFADVASTIAVQSDGKIVVGGFSNLDSSNITTSKFAIARYNSNGTLDNTFNNTGIKLINVGNNSTISSLLITPDGKIVLGGNGGSGSTLAFVRLQPNGDLDSSFATNGTFLITGNNNFKTLQHFDLQVDGKIVVTTNSSNAASSGIRIFRLNPSGTLDLTFGTNGFAIINSTSSQGVYSEIVKVLPDSNILIGTKQNTLNFDSPCFLKWYHKTGTLLNTIEYSPVLLYQTGLNYLVSAIVQPWDNKLIITSRFSGYYGNYNFILGRLSGMGYFDGSFGNSGLAFTSFEDSYSSPIGTFILSNGKIITIGTSGYNVVMARYNNPNSPLPIESSNLLVNINNGKAVLSWETYKEINNRGYQIERSSDGKNFYFIGFVKSKAQSSISNGRIQYSFIDYEPLSPTSYYRFRQIDLDERFTYSNIVKLNIDKDTKFSIKAMPNPVTSKLNLLINSNAQESGYINVYDISGKLATKIKANKVEVSIDMSNYTPGIYLIKYIDNEHNKVLTITKQ